MLITSCTSAMRDTAAPTLNDTLINRKQSRLLLNFYV